MRMRTISSLLATAALAIALTSTSKAAIITADFQATNDLPFSIFETGDSVTGTFSYSNSVLTPGSPFVSEQNAPIASLSLTYTDLSTGQTATARSDATPNVSPDLQVRNTFGVDVDFGFRNFTTDPNTVFGGTGIFFDQVFVRFKTIITDATLPQDLSNLTPTYLTMRIGFNSIFFGPNFKLDFVRVTSVQEEVKAPEPSSLLTLAIGGVLIGTIRRRRSKARTPLRGQYLSTRP